MNLESLESRRMLSVSFTLDSTGLLSIIGTRANDSVHLGSKAHFKEDFARYTNIDFSKVNRILVNMMAGNDTVILNDKIHVPVTMIGGSGNDSLRAGGGDDHIIADQGDTICGGDGFDTADFSGATAGIKLDLSDATTEAVMGSPFADTITGSDKNDIILGEGGGDSINGMNGDDYIDGGAGQDKLDGGAGDDVFVNFDTSPDTVIGGGGTDFAEQDNNDTFQDIDLVFDQTLIDYGQTGGETGGETGGGESGGTTPGAITPQTATAIHQALALAVSANSFATLSGGQLNITGTSSADSISVILDSTGKNISVSVNGASETFSKSSVTSLHIDAAGGNDTVALQRSDGSRALTLPAIILGSNGNDNITGGASNDTISGGNGDDIIRGMAGEDSLSGDNGNDHLDGGDGNDILNGGDLAITGPDGADTLTGGTGDSDSVLYTARTDNLSIDINNSSKSNDGAAGEGDKVNSDIENIFSGSGNDTLTGNSASNLISGNAGDDVIQGNGGHDKIIGGVGNDSLANAGADATMFSMLDQSRDTFDSALDANGRVVNDLISGDIATDFSSASGRLLG